MDKLDLLDNDHISGKLHSEFVEKPTILRFVKAHGW
jgi:hypothetical protein